MTTIQNIDTTLILAGNNDRKVFDPQALTELAASIKEHGLAQPITVRPMGDKFQIVAGERRFRAISQILKWETVPAIVRTLTDEEASAIMLVENTSRADLNPIEEAQAYQVRRQTYGWDLERIARVAGVSEDLIKRRLALLGLVEEAQHLVANGHLPLGHAEALSALDGNRQRIALRIFSQGENVSLRVFRGIIGQLLEEQSRDGLFDLENFWVSQVQNGADVPTRGKHAIVDVPVRHDLPQVEQPDNKASASTVIFRYIRSLQESGMASEAATIGTLYAALVRLNYMSAVA